MKKHIANAITGFRILGSVAMLLFPVPSIQFYSLYLFCGFTDMVDGTVARKTNSKSIFGARFDTAADFIFVAVSFIKFLPLIHIPIWLWTWIAVIAIIKSGNIIWGFTIEKKLVSLHTIMNKATGVLLFLLPLTVQLIELKYSLMVVCMVATFSAIQEVYYIRAGREII